MNPSELTLCIMTCPRKPSYITQTLANVFMSDPLIFDVGEINLVIDSGKQNYLRNYQQFSRVNRCFPTPKQGVEEHKFFEVSGLPPKKQKEVRFCYTYCRCLDMIGDSEGILILEDDIIVRDHFIEHLFEALNEIYDDKFIVALKTRTNIAASKKLWQGKYHLSYPFHDFLGTTGMYYSKAVVSEVRKYIWTHGVVNHRYPGDELVKELVKKNKYLYALCADLVEHVGTTSFIGNFDYGDLPSHTFKLPWKPLGEK